jgi:hypothetical protein
VAEPVRNGDRINADPSKKFFIEMLTRDINLTNCILDLIDNSVHSLISDSGLDVMENLVRGTNPPKLKSSIEVTFNSRQFKIHDDCGGIPTDDARNGVFLFGNPTTDLNHTGLGLYGIGMKRAMFKIGRSISVTSHTENEGFTVDINVEKWEQDPEWKLDFTDKWKRRYATGETEITIKDLNSAAATQFSLKHFQTNLLGRIATAYALFLRAGLKITVNGVLTTPEFPVLTESTKLKSARQHFKRDGVDILLMCGLSPPEDRTPRGWYVFCNGRMVLEADKTVVTGWGTHRLPAFHSKYNHFLGYAYFRSKDPYLLPWTTTKDGVDLESPIYQEALNEMAVQARPALNFLNTLYSDVKEQSEPERELFESGDNVDPKKVAGKKNQTFSATPKNDMGEELVSIQYRRKQKQIDKIREFLEKPKLAAYRVGELTFDWFFDRNCKK